MQILNLHEMQGPIFWDKIRKTNILECRLLTFWSSMQRVDSTVYIFVYIFVVWFAFLHTKHLLIRGSTLKGKMPRKECILLSEGRHVVQSVIRRETNSFDRVTSPDNTSLPLSHKCLACLNVDFWKVDANNKLSVASDQGLHYTIYRMYSDRQAQANSVELYETPQTRVYTVCHSSSNFCIQHRVVNYTMFKF